MTLDALERSVAVVDVMETHVNCRCTMVPRAKSYADLLGDPSLPDTRPDMGTGPEAFAKLSPAIQAEILGPGKMALYRRGIPLEAMWRSSTSGEWGTSRVGKSLRQLREEIAAGTWTLGPETQPLPPAKDNLPPSVRGHIERLADALDVGDPTGILQGTLYKMGVQSELSFTASEWAKLDAEHKAQLVADMQTLLDRSELSTRRSEGAALKILKEGRFKTQFETGDSSGVYDPEYRALEENRMFGYPTDRWIGPDGRPTVPRPVYGYFWTGDYAVSGYDGGSSYGHVRFVLSPEARARTTVTWEDSLGATGVIPSSAVDVRAISLNRPLREVARQGETNYLHAGSYIEAQIHGELSMSDVIRIELDKPDPVLEAALIDAGWVDADPGGYGRSWVRRP